MAGILPLPGIPHPTHTNCTPGPSQGRQTAQFLGHRRAIEIPAQFVYKAAKEERRLLFRIFCLRPRSQPGAGANGQGVEADPLNDTLRGGKNDLWSVPTGRRHPFVVQSPQPVRCFGSVE